MRVARGSKAVMMDEVPHCSEEREELYTTRSAHYFSFIKRCHLFHFITACLPLATSLMRRKRVPANSQPGFHSRGCLQRGKRQPMAAAEGCAARIRPFHWLVPRELPETAPLRVRFGYQAR
ncbi:hypothetical protein NDU88_001836 [Pleurodeles waltl]|uniref:Uncharacterized protein n=1 Tax=Pleurodeles waltl TaxID=8319 RepID=A0AAV7P504_PLEWA|nr:hypothetical protein NDU88_001836 [Pleurodeles waltl]